MLGVGFYFRIVFNIFWCRPYDFRTFTMGGPGFCIRYLTSTIKVMVVMRMMMVIDEMLTMLPIDGMKNEMRMSNGGLGGERRIMGLDPAG